MPDVHGTPGIRLADDWHPMTGEHSTATRVGPMQDRALCHGCGTILRARYYAFRVRHADDEHGNHEHMVNGAYVAPDDGPPHPFLPFHEQDMTWCQVNTPQHSATRDEEAEAPKPRPASISAASAAKGRTRDTPSRSKEARHAEYVRGKRRRVQAEA